LEFYNGSLSTDNATNLNIWRGFYSVIYQANALLEGLEKPNGVSPEVAKQLRGESKFLRAFSYFYLVNLYGDVPLFTTTDVYVTSVAARTSSNEIYQQIISDLEEAKNLLQISYPSGEKVRANRWAATALLARAYLYKSNWSKAESEAESVISSNLYTPLDNTTNAFKKGSREAILQIWTQNGNTSQGAVLVPTTGTPSYYLTGSFINTFEANDLRKGVWTSTFASGSTSYNLSTKYKKNTTTTGTDAEYLILLRSAEQYLIRAEAKAEQNNLTEAVTDLNAIRIRAGLPGISVSISKDSCIALIRNERKKELFTEWGHRFLDLKRWGKLNTEISALKPTWSAKSALLPIPQNEINRNPNLTQNFGY
jgi:hypothetical protein